MSRCSQNCANFCEWFGKMLLNLTNILPKMAANCFADKYWHAYYQGYGYIIGRYTVFYRTVSYIPAPLNAYCGYIKEAAILFCFF